MIHFYAANGYCWTIEEFIREWAPALAARIRPVAYDRIPLGFPTPQGLHLFTDFERLLPPEFAFVRRLSHRLCGYADSYRTLNDPAQWSGRFGLLSRLSQAGINDYRAYRLHELGPQVRFPVFLRFEHDHSGSLSEPIHTMPELRELIRDQLGRNRRRQLLRRYLMVIEHLDVRGADGLYRKYSAMKIGDRLIPRHVFVSADRWVQKSPDLMNADTLEEERDYSENFPHADQVDDIFRLAGLRYGRIDYGFCNGRMQVWEINTNPVIAPPRARIASARLPLQQASAAAMAAAFERLLPDSLGGPARRLFRPPEQFGWQALAGFSRFYDRYRE